VFPVYRTPSTNPANPQFSFLADSQDNFAWAVFANLGYEFSEQFRVDGSLRYDHDKRENTTLTPTAFLPNVPGFPAGATGEVREQSFDDWQPKLTLTWMPNRDVTLYAGYSRGFRSGGFNQTGVGAVAAANGIVGVSDIFQAETADTFEAGFKTSLFDDVLSFNGAAFHHQVEEQLLLRVPRRQLDAEPRQRARDAHRRLRARGVRAPGARHPDQRRARHDLERDQGVPRSRGDRQRGPADLALDLQPRLPVDARKLNDTLDGLMRVDYRRTGDTWWEVYNTTVRDPINLVDARAGVEGGALGRVHLRLEHLRRGIQRRVLAGRVRVQGQAAGLWGGGVV
jgi:iron complex outermembrane receptor protein